MNIPTLLAQELSLTPQQVQSALELFTEGATVPFIARYRKERTGEMDEIQLRDLLDRFTYLTELEARKSTILDSIQTQGKLTPELEKQITSCLNKTELEDLYLPYKPKRRTRAMIARERGLEPLAVWIKGQNVSNGGAVNLNAEAEKYLNPENGITNAAQALAGASDILAEEVADQAKHRSFLREWLTDTGLFVAKISDKLPEGSTQFEMYRNYQSKVKTIQPHNLLALFRGETENIISFDLTFDEEQVLGYLAQQEVKTKTPELRQFYLAMLKDAFNRLMKTSLIGEIRSQCKLSADIASIKTFESNLRELLLSAPAGMKPTLAIDPGFRTGCKVSVLDQTGKFLEYQAIFPHTGDYKREQAKADLKKLIAKYQVSLIAIGNGTAGRETDDFVTEILAEIEVKPVKVMVNESGASIYSASPVAISEFPDLDITVRGAISIGRRLQDPLAELVKIDPKSIGVGQYQHDVDQKLLKKQLDETVESCVNYVGVDLNTASKELLTFVSGINATIANNIVQYRNENGAFQDRKALLKVANSAPKPSNKPLDSCASEGAKNALDNTAVHPERYALVNAIAKDLGIPLTDCKTLAQQLSSNLRKYISEEVGEPTLRDIVAELEKPGRDPRAEFRYATFRSDIKEISDLRPGLELEGVITNVVAFGAFVDIGVHQDGLVHVSQLADRYVSDPTQVVKVGQVVKVTVVEVNAGLKRIALSMRSGGSTSPPPDTRKPQAGKPQLTNKPQGKPQAGNPQPSPEPTSSEPATLADLQARFGKKR